MKLKETLTLVVVGLLVVSGFSMAVGNIGSGEKTESEEDEFVDRSYGVELQDLADSPWPSFGRDRKNTGLSPYDTSHVDGTKKNGPS